MKVMRKVIAAVTIVAVAAGMCSCSAPERRHKRDRDRDDEEEEETVEETVEDLPSGYEKEFGSYEVGYGWGEVDDQSDPPYYFAYCMSGNEDSDEAPNNIAVSYGSNYYSKEEGADFTSAILQQITGQAAQYNGTAAMTEYSEDPDHSYYRFDMECEDFTVIQWYLTGDYEYVMVSLMISDEDKAEEENAMEVAQQIVDTFEWET